MEEKIMALADFLELKPEEIKQSEYDENTFVTDNEYVEEEYLVFDDYDDAEEAAKQDVLDLFDDLGLDSFTKSARDYVIDTFIDEEFVEENRYELDDYDSDTIAEHTDLDAMSEWVVEQDGIAHHIARYDGIENEHEYDGTTYWIYRTK